MECIIGIVIAAIVVLSARSLANRNTGADNPVPEHNGEKEFIDYLLETVVPKCRERQSATEWYDHFYFIYEAVSLDFVAKTRKPLVLNDVHGTLRNAAQAAILLERTPSVPA